RRDDHSIPPSPTRRSSDLTHNLAEVQVTCQRVLIIAGGRLVADDTPEGLTASRGRPRLLVTMKREPSFDASAFEARLRALSAVEDRKSTRLNSSHVKISYA